MDILMSILQSNILFIAYGSCFLMQVACTGFVIYNTITKNNEKNTRITKFIITVFVLNMIFTIITNAMSDRYFYFDINTIIGIMNMIGWITVISIIIIGTINFYKVFKKDKNYSSIKALLFTSLVTIGSMLVFIVPLTYGY